MYPSTKILVISKLYTANNSHIQNTKMKAYGVDKQDDCCCPGHAKYGRCSSKEMNRPRKPGADRPRKKKARAAAKKIED